MITLNASSLEIVEECNDARILFFIFPSKISKESDMVVAFRFIMTMMDQFLPGAAAA
jgi:hypothetical protein